MTLGHLARVERDRGNLGEARKRIEEALEIVEGLRTKVASQQLRASFFASVQQYREFYIDLLMRLHKENPSQQLDRSAFNASETGRARSLLELLSEANAEIHHGVDPALLERERKLERGDRGQGAKPDALLSGEHTEEQAKRSRKELAALTTDYEQVEASNSAGESAIRGAGSTGATQARRDPTEGSRSRHAAARVLVGRGEEFSLGSHA